MTGLGQRKAGSGYSWHPSVVQNNKVQQGSWESPNYVSRNSTPPKCANKGVELIFHSFPNPPLHPSLIRLPDSPHPAPGRQPVLCHTSPSFSATSGRKLTIEQAPPATTPRLYPSCQKCTESSRLIKFLLPQIRPACTRNCWLCPVHRHAVWEVAKITVRSCTHCPCDPKDH